MLKPAKDAWLKAIQINKEKIQLLELEIAEMYSKIAWIESEEYDDKS